jgi:choline dehydrogenase-like flavoprotein
MSLSEYTPSDAQDTTWDVLVIGTGAGGGPAGLNLAKRGKSVLLVERGVPWDGTSSASKSPRLQSLNGKVFMHSVPYDKQAENSASTKMRKLVRARGFRA